MLDDRAMAGAGTRQVPACLDGRPFTALLLEDDQRRDAALATLLSGLAKPEVRVVRMGNSMRSRLMLEHILIQATGSGGGMSLADKAQCIARTIAERQRREAVVILLITQAETLHSKTLRLLQAMTPYLAQGGAPTLQVVFVGRPAFWDMLDGEGLAPLREALGVRAGTALLEPAAAGDLQLPTARLSTIDAGADILTELGSRTPTPGMGSPPNVGPRAAEKRDSRSRAALPGLAAARVAVPEPIAASPPPMLAPSPRARPTMTKMPRTRVLARSPLMALAVAAALAGAAYVGMKDKFDRRVMTRPFQNSLGQAAAEPRPAPAALGNVAPSVTVTQNPPANQPANPRADFEPASELGRNGTVASRTRRGPVPAEPAAGRSYNDAGPSVPIGLPDPRVVIHVPAGSDAAEATAARLLASLGAHPGSVEARRVPGTPDRPSIRYFYPGDEAVAQRVAVWTADSGVPWTLRDFSNFQPRPSRGTIELWLPRP